MVQNDPDATGPDPDTPVASPKPQRNTEPSRVILDIASGYLLKSASVKDWYERYRDAARRSPTEICLPAVGFAGPYFDSAVQPPPGFVQAADPLQKWVRDARDVLGEGGVVWGKFNVDLAFLQADHLCIRNQYDETLNSVCISNPIVQTISHTLITEVLARGVDGIVFDVCNLYPNAGATHLSESELAINCFCQSCRRLIRSYGFELHAEDFIGSKNLMRLVLRNTGSGTRHIDPTQEMLDTGNATLLLASAESQGFIDTSEGDWAASARKVLMYCEARSTATAASLRNLSQPVGDAGKRSAIILNSMNFDQSQQVTLRAALRGPSADEFWLPDATEDLAGEARIVCYLATRGTYSLNALYELVETASSVLVSGGVNAFLSRLVRVSNRAEGASNLTPGAVFACLQSPQYEGVVGIPILKNDLLNIINTLASSLTGQRIPEEALEAMRLALGSPDFADEDE